MKHIYIILGIMFVALLVTWTQLPEIETDDRLINQLPWIIRTDNTGGSSVFGLTLEQSTVRQAEDTFNDEAEFAVFIDEDESRSLEAFFNYTRIAGLQARITLTLKTTPEELQAIASQAIDKKAQPSNSYKLVLPDELDETLYNLGFTSLTYQPKIQIEREVLSARFGKPEQDIPVDEHTRQWLYPAKGLSILTSTEDKPVFVYVRPDRFNYYHNISKVNDGDQGASGNNLTE